MSELGEIDSGAPAHGAVVGDTCLALASVFRGDEDDTVGGTRSVDGCRCGILEHRDALNLGGCEVVHVAGESVDKDQRGGVSTE